MNSFITPEALSERIDGLDRLFKMQAEAYQNAISVALEVNNERLLRANNWREQFNLLTGTLVTRIAYDNKNTDIEKKIKEQADEIEALKAAKANLTGLMTGITLVLGAAMFILKFLVKG